MNKIEAFMNIYMYELEKYLIKRKEELRNVSFQSDEANTDRPLKEFLKHIIEEEFFKIPDTCSVKRIIENNTIALNNENNELNSISISKVLLPEEITDEIKTLIKKNNSIFTKPDLCLKITDSTFNANYYETIELKSTNKDSIPGSSIQQISPNEWVLFIKHQKNGNFEITSGKYINAITTKMEFPDRSPRPQVSFEELKKWNKEYRLLHDNILLYKEDINIYMKQELILDWQKVLVDRWIDLLFDFHSIKNNESWFNNTLRKFIIEFLYKYENLSNEDKQKYKDSIIKLIK